MYGKAKICGTRACGTHSAKACGNVGTTKAVWELSIRWTRLSVQNRTWIEVTFGSSTRKVSPLFDQRFFAYERAQAKKSNAGNNWRKERQAFSSRSVESYLHHQRVYVSVQEYANWTTMKRKPQCRSAIYNILCYGTLCDTPRYIMQSRNSRVRFSKEPPCPR